MTRIEWDVIAPMHVQKASELVASREAIRDRTTGLVLFVGERRLSAKDVLREAYRIAKGLPQGAEVKFASNESTLTLLRKLGFRAERLGSRKEHVRDS